MNSKVYIATSSERSIIKTARKGLSESDPNLAASMLRDLPVTEAAGLKDMAWVMLRDGALHVNDVLYLFEKLDHYMRSCKLCTENPRSYEPYSPGAPPLVDSDYCTACSKTKLRAAGDRNRLRFWYEGSRLPSRYGSPWEIEWQS